VDESVEKTVTELLDHMKFIADLQSGKYGKITRPKQMEDCIDEMRDSLTNLSFVVKYISFDLEATRRENYSLRKLLEKKRRK
jgi:hypothetical protein